PKTWLCSTSYTSPTQLALFHCKQRRSRKRRLQILPFHRLLPLNPLLYRGSILSQALTHAHCSQRQSKSRCRRVGRLLLPACMRKTRHCGRTNKSGSQGLANSAAKPRQFSDQVRPTFGPPLTTALVGRMLDHDSNEQRSQFGCPEAH